MSDAERPHETLDFPVNLLLDGRAVLLVGAGRIAARKLAAIRAAGARVTVVAPDVCEEIAVLEGPLVHIERRAYASTDLDGKWFVTEATGDSEVAAQVFRDAEAARIFCNAADRPRSCSATLPAVHRQGAVSVTYSTGGTIPALSAWLRDQGAHSYGPEYGEFAALLGEARREVQRSGTSTESLDWRGLLDSGILEDVRSGRTAQAKERVLTWLSSS